jgi:hypothetical protein
MKDLKEFELKIGEILDSIESIDLSKINVSPEEHKRLRVKTHGIYHKVMLFHAYIQSEAKKATNLHSPSMNPVQPNP